MIISHKYKFIFLKTRKTAGTSIEIALSKFCGQNDLITPIAAKDERIRTNLGYPGPQNYLVPYSRYNLKDGIQSFRERERRRFYNHIPAYDVRRWIGKRIWDTYFKFCFERNPWDKAISRYSFATTFYKEKISLEEFLQHPDELPKLTNYPMYTIHDHLAVDRVYFYEELPQELEAICEQFKFPEVPPLPMTKAGFRKDKRPYQEVISTKERELIEKICQREIALFGYTFDSLSRR
jgi:Sulfotransferase family